MAITATTRSREHEVDVAPHAGEDRESNETDTDRGQRTRHDERRNESRAQHAAVNDATPT